MSEQVLFVRLFTAAALAQFKAQDEETFEKCTPLAKDKDADLLVNPFDREPVDPNELYGVAKPMSPAAAKLATTTWLNALRSLSGNAALQAEEACEVVPWSNVTDPVRQVVMRRSEQLAFDRLTSLTLKLAAKPPASNASSNGGGPRLKRPSSSNASTRTNKKHFKRRLVVGK